MSVTIDSELEDAIDAVLVAKALFELRQAVPFVFDFYNDPINDPFSATRFGMTHWTSTEFMILDGHTNDEHVVLRSQLMDPDFDLVSWLFAEKCKIEDQLLDGPVIEKDIPEELSAFLGAIQWC
jgi:hypothetical protein